MRRLFQTLDNTFHRFELRGGKRGRQTQKHKSRSLQIEPLEQRQLLSVMHWDPSHSGGTALGGTGNWMGSNNWWNGSSDVTWTSANDDATFQVTGGGSAGVVTLDSAVSAAMVTFASAGYTLGGSALTLTGTGTTLTANQSATINSEINVSASQQWTVAYGQTLSVNGNVGLATYNVTIQGEGNSSISGIISGSGGLAKTGSGTLTLSGANIYDGGTTISDGILQITDGCALGSGTVADNGTLIFAASNDYTLSNYISGDGAIWNSSSGLLTIYLSDYTGSVNNCDYYFENECCPSLVLYGDITNLWNTGNLTWYGDLSGRTYSVNSGSLTWTGVCSDESYLENVGSINWTGNSSGDAITGNAYVYNDPNASIALLTLA